MVAEGRLIPAETQVYRPPERPPQGPNPPDLTPRLEAILEEERADRDFM